MERKGGDEFKLSKFSTKCIQASNKLGGKEVYEKNNISNIISPISRVYIRSQS